METGENRPSLEGRKLLLRRLALTHAVPCLFLGVLCIQFLDWLTRASWVDAYLHAGVKYGALAAMNVLLVGLAVRLHQLYQRRVVGRVRLALYDVPLDGRQQAAAVGVGAVFGFLGLVLLLSEWGVLALTLVAVSVAVRLWRLFARGMSRMLLPGHYATWQDVQKLLSIYAIMIVCFSLINASLNMLHDQLQLGDAFGHPPSNAPAVFDSFYYTVVVVTTLGFGDIYPLSVDAKLFLIVQSVASAVMFALIVGVATRGVMGRQGEQ